MSRSTLPRVALMVLAMALPFSADCEHDRGPQRAPSLGRFGCAAQSLSGLAKRR